MEKGISNRGTTVTALSRTKCRTTDKTLDKESNINNIVKDEILTDNENLPTDAIEGDTNELGLVSVPALPSTRAELPDTTQNLLVSLPIETSIGAELTDTTPILPIESQLDMRETTAMDTDRVSELPITVCCSINLTDISVKLVDGRMVLPTPKIPLEPK